MEIVDLKNNTGLVLSNQTMKVLEDAVGDLPLKIAGPVAEEFRANLSAPPPCADCLSLLDKKLCNHPAASKVGMLSMMALPMRAVLHRYCALKELQNAADTPQPLPDQSSASGSQADYSGSASELHSREPLPGFPDYRGDSDA